MKRPLVVYPFLFGLFAVLSLFASNMTEYSLGVIYRPLLTLIGATLLGLIVIGVLFRSLAKAAVLVTICLFFFLSFSHLLAVIPDVGFHVGARRIHTAHFIVGFAVVLWLAVAYLLVTTKSDLANLTRILNVFGVALVAIPAFQVAAYEIRTFGWRDAADRVSEDGLPAASLPADPPHVFYIVLDGYGRADVLEELYGHDNSALVDFLESRGFFVASRSRTNYSHTVFSLASTLNMEYLDWMPGRFPSGFRDMEPAAELLRRSRVRRFFEERGYRFAAVWTGYSVTEITDADIYVDDLRQRNEFEEGFWKLTSINTNKEKSDIERYRILQGFDALRRLARSEQPLFVFDHIVAPHPPFVFNRDGGPRQIEEYIGLASANHLTNEDRLTRAEYMDRYVEQLVFVNKRLMESIDAILDAARVEPIIIVQGDHGPGSFLCHHRLDQTYLVDRMSILNAYHLPAAGETPLYESITPVNSFRVVLNRHFGLDLPLLEDRSYFSERDRPYAFIDVTDEIGSAEDMRRWELLSTRENAGERSRSSGDDVVCPIE